MNTERLFPVLASPGLLDHFEPQVRITVVLQEAVPPGRGRSSGHAGPLDDLQELLRAWGLLGFSAAMPSEGLFEVFHGRREDVFSSGFRLTKLLYADDGRVEWFVDYDGVSEAWLDILLNCLEGFHVQIAPIARVELTSDVEPSSVSPPRSGSSSVDSSANRPSRKHRWWPFGTSESKRA